MMRRRDVFPYLGDWTTHMQLREILTIKDSPYARQFRHVVSVVDQLHKFPTLPTIPLLLTRSRREGGGYIFGVRPSVPISINISIYADSPPITLLHEIAHCSTTWRSIPSNRILAASTTRFSTRFGISGRPVGRFAV
jgi:hypothetical protein